MEQNATQPLAPATYAVPGFCREHNISRSYLYQLWSEGRGPRRMKVGRRTLITREAAAEWRRRMEAETAVVERHLPSAWGEPWQ